MESGEIMQRSFDESGSSEDLLGLLNGGDQFKIEVPTLFVNFTSGFSAVVVSNLLLLRFCTNALENPKNLCLDIINSNGNLSDFEQEIENKIQKDTSLLLMTSGIMCGAFPAVLGFFVGAWSDSYGRKPLIVWPLFGFTVTSIGLVLFSFLESLDPWWYLLVILPYYVMGGDSVLALGSNCILCDSTNEGSRMKRLAILQVFSNVGYVVGCIASYYAYTALGYVYLLLISAVFATLAYSCSIIFIGDSVGAAGQGRLSNLFNSNSIKGTFSVLKTKENRNIIILLITTYSINCFATSGTTNLDYLFTRKKFHWTMKHFNEFTAVSCVAWLVGTAFAVEILQKCLGLQEPIILMISFLSLLSDGLTRLLSQSQWGYYAAGSLSFMGGVSFPLLRSILSTVVKTEEIGKMFAVLSILEAVFPLLSPAFFNSLYAFTLNGFTAVIYLLVVVSYTLCLSFSFAAYLLLRRRRR